jgi:hypothetical protein
MVKFKIGDRVQIRKWSDMQRESLVLNIMNKGARINEYNKLSNLRYSRYRLHSLL